MNPIANLIAILPLVHGFTHYDKGSEKSRAKLLEEHSKAIDALTINENNRLRKKVKELTLRSDQMDELRSAIDELRARAL